MATTWITSLHKGGGTASSLKKSLDYVINPKKTANGELIRSYKCYPPTAKSDFILSKQLYARQTGRNQGDRDVIAYHMRMSFKPGEVTPEKALELGNELAHRWTKDKHQYIVAAHTDTANPHVHIIYNSTNLEHNGKWQDFKRSAIVLRRVSDQLCLEHGLSVIENPALSKGFNRDEYMGQKKKPTVRDQLCQLMDQLLPQCHNLDDLLTALRESGVEIKQGKQLSFKLPEASRFVRHDTLGDSHSLEAILERLATNQLRQPESEFHLVQAEDDTDNRGHFHPHPQPTLAQNSVEPTEKIPPYHNTVRPNLLIDIQTKIQQGYGKGYEQFAHIHNIKEMSKTLMYLSERKLDSYDDLKALTAQASADFHQKTAHIREIETRQQEIADLQKQIGTYGKTRETYAEYQRLKKTPLTALQKLKNAQHPAEHFYETNRANIALHEAARRYFDSQGFGKGTGLPKIAELKHEYAMLEAEKKNLYATYKYERDEMRDLQMALHNVNRIMGVPSQVQEQVKNREHEPSL